MGIMTRSGRKATSRGYRHLSRRAAVVLAIFVLASCRTAVGRVDSNPWLFRTSELQRRMTPETETWRVRKIMSRMTLHQKIGQRFICWIEGTELGEQAGELVRQGAAGVILYPWNVEDPEQVRRLTASLQRAARAGDPPIGFFVCVDQ